jgi:glutathione S-transferase
MVFVTPTTTEVLQWEGLHLFHFEQSTCSKKVRTVLALKELNCELHHIDLRTHENKVEHFLGINPRGLLPVLVHDGRVIVENNDIVAYLDEAFGPNSSIPTRGLADATTPAALRAEDALHMAIRTLTFSFRIPSVLGRVPEDKLSVYRDRGASVKGNGQDHAQQITFWTSYNEHGGCSGDAIVNAYDAIREAFDGLEEALNGAQYLSTTCDVLSLTDVVWFPTVRRIFLCGYDLRRYGSVSLPRHQPDVRTQAPFSLGLARAHADTLSDRPLRRADGRPRQRPLRVAVPYGNDCRGLRRGPSSSSALQAESLTT